MYFYVMFLPFQYTISCYSWLSSVKKKIMSKGKKILSQAVWFFFVFYVGLTYILGGLLFTKKVSQWI